MSIEPFQSNHFLLAGGRHQTFTKRRSTSVPNLSVKIDLLEENSYSRLRQRNLVIDQIQGMCHGEKCQTYKINRKQKLLCADNAKRIKSQPVEEEKIKNDDSQIESSSESYIKVKYSKNHNEKLTKFITNILIDMKIDFNLEIIHQMSLNEKMRLHQKLELALQINKQKNLYELKNNLSENDANIESEKFRNAF